MLIRSCTTSKPQLCLWGYLKEYSNIYDKSLGILDQQPEERFWSLHSAIVSKGKTMTKQKIVQGHAWKMWIKRYNKRVSQPSPSSNYDGIEFCCAVKLDSPTVFISWFSLTKETKYWLEIVRVKFSKVCIKGSREPTLNPITHSNETFSSTLFTFWACLAFATIFSWSFFLWNKWS